MKTISALVLSAALISAPAFAAPTFDIKSDKDGAMTLVVKVKTTCDSIGECVAVLRAAKNFDKKAKLKKGAKKSYVTFKRSKSLSDADLDNLDSIVNTLSSGN